MRKVGLPHSGILYQIYDIQKSGISISSAYVLSCGSPHVVLSCSVLASRNLLDVDAK